MTIVKIMTKQMKGVVKNLQRQQKNTKLIVNIRSRSKNFSRRREAVELGMNCIRYEGCQIQGCQEKQTTPSSSIWIIPLPFYAKVRHQIHWIRLWIDTWKEITQVPTSTAPPTPAPLSRPPSTSPTEVQPKSNRSPTEVPSSPPAPTGQNVNPPTSIEGDCSDYLVR